MLLSLTYNFFDRDILVAIQYIPFVAVLFRRNTAAFPPNMWLFPSSNKGSSLLSRSNFLLRSVFYTLWCYVSQIEFFFLEISVSVHHGIFLINNLPFLFGNALNLSFVPQQMLMSYLSIINEILNRGCLHYVACVRSGDGDFLSVYATSHTQQDSNTQD
jgi:hypothetical protein